MTHIQLDEKELNRQEQPESYRLDKGRSVGLTIFPTEHTSTDLQITRVPSGAYAINIHYIPAQSTFDHWSLFLDPAELRALRLMLNQLDIV